MPDLTQEELELIVKAVEDFKEGNRCFLSYIATNSDEIAEAETEQKLIQSILIKVHKAQKRLRKESNLASTRFQEITNSPEFEKIADTPIKLIE